MVPLLPLLPLLLLNHSRCLRIYKLPACNFHSLPVYLRFNFIGTFSFSRQLCTSQLLQSNCGYSINSFPPLFHSSLSPFIPLELFSLCGCTDALEQIINKLPRWSFIRFGICDVQYPSHLFMQTLCFYRRPSFATRLRHFFFNK